MSRKKVGIIVAALVLWFVGVVGAFGLVWKYKTTPGGKPEAPETWPADSKIVLAPDRPNLVMFAHPQCPCTRASMAELARLAVELGSEAQIHVAIVRPPGTDDGFEEGAVAERARAIGGAKVFIDVDGVEAARFGAVTSGSTVLYTARNQLAFRGGITTARGHEGHGPAQDRIVAIVKAGTGDSSRTLAPTFGCELGAKPIAGATAPIK
jgi:hypothetical protein